MFSFKINGFCANKTHVLSSEAMKLSHDELECQLERIIKEMFSRGMRKLVTLPKRVLKIVISTYLFNFHYLDVWRRRTLYIHLKLQVVSINLHWV